MEDIRKILFEDTDYPDSLRNIQNPPKVIYYRGRLVKDDVCLAIVGSRVYSLNGKQMVTKITEELIDSNITIVSGLAFGIDTFAHETCVEKKKRTIAVLGTGLDDKSIYPKENLELAKKIIECGGCLISELPPESHGSRFTFPNRNRIISGLSIGVVVIEAREKSGSLITTKYAKIQKRKIFAVPGSEGTDKLIKEGAITIKDSKDILKELNIK